MTRTPRFGVLLILALLVAIAAGVYLSQQERGMSFGYWPRFEMDEVASIEIATRKETYALVREQGGWVVRLANATEDSIPIPADKAKIEGLLAAIAHNRPTQNLGPQQAIDPAVYGFDNPAVRLLLKSSSKDLHDVLLVLGNETPTGAAIHAQCSLSPGTVVLLDANVLHQFGNPAEHYFDAHLLPLQSEEAQRVSFTGATGSPWVLERQDDTFIFTAPEALRGTSVGASEVRLYLHNLAAFTADSILTGPASPPAAKPQFSVEVLATKGGTAQRVEFFAPGEDQLTFGRSTWHPTGFLVDKDKARSLYRMAFDMQWRGVLGVDASRIERARVYSVQGNQTLNVDKGPEVWVERDTGRQIPGIDITLWRLKELRVEAEPETRLAYPAELRLVLELFGKDPKPLSVFSFYVDPRLPAGQCWLKPGQEEAYYPVGTQIIEDLLGHLPPRAHKPAPPVEAAGEQRKP